MEETVAAVRHFNRFYTKQIGALRQHLLGTEHTLTESRVLYELAHRTRPNAAALCAELALDPGYLSRLLAKLERRGLVARERAPDDGRRSLLALTPAGEKAFGVLDRRAREQAAAMLAGVGAEEQASLVAALQTVERTLSADRAEAKWALRSPRAGDLGWVVQRHGALYAREHAWDESFEGLVAGIVASFAAGHDPSRERCWIAELDGENVGCVFLVARSKRVAQLRLLLVEPRARGLGIGARLVDECLRFAREAEYGKVVLWTNDVLGAARRIYERAGFTLVEQAPHRSFGQDLVGQTWELALR
jgi:DNA-binding MarR family transcriptional regulator/N-acetylglutamate synthase-like GNAT family acetyltransferase